MTRQTGILPDQKITELHESGAISSLRNFDDDQIQPASLDLRLGMKAYRVRASFLPGKASSVAEKLERFKLHELDLENGAILETGCVYLVPLLESLDLPQDVSASANPKSSTGRLDIFTRVIVDNSQAFDQIPAGYSGPLYLEISPSTFPVVVRTGSRLSQIRFRNGNTTLDEDELLALHASQTLVATSEPNIHNQGIGLSIDLSGDENGLVGYRGKRHTGLVDVDKKAAHAVLDFWEPIYNLGTDDLVLDPDEFYILVSQEAVHVPPLYAAEMVPFDPLVGEFRVHYAGFFDPGFGHADAGGLGARGVLEVRSHEVPFILEHGQLVGRLVYEHMLSKPEKLYGTDLGSNYQAQGLKLSKHFRS
ncbi:MAG: 2'-deoxycytidine 5'-triphosphate deaminase [Pseudomonadota bacterium]